MKTHTDSQDDIRSIVDRSLIPHTNFQRAVDRIEQCMHAMQNCADPIGLAIVGESRTGKSRTLEHMESRYPAYRTDNGRTVPFLRTRVPSKPTVKGLATLLLYSLGDPAYDRGTEIAKTLRLIALLERTETRVLALDEFQHFYDKTTRKVQHHVADWLKVLVDDARVGLVVTGLPNCLSVIQQNEQLAGRFMAPIQLPRFDWRREDERAVFTGILLGIAKNLSAFKWPRLDATEIAFRFYCASGGLIGYLTKLFKQVIWNALESGSRTIGLPQLSVAHHEALIKEDPVLQSGFDPFERSFSCEPTDELLHHVRTIGTASDEPPTPRQSSRSRTPKSSEVLSRKR